MNEKLNIVAVTWQTPITGGGGLRAYRSLKEYVKYFNTHLFITWRVWNNKALLQKSTKYLYELKSCGVRFAGFSFISGRTLRFLKVFGRRILETSTLLLPQLMRVKVGLSKFDAIIALHEDWDVVYVGHALARSFNIPSIVFLHNPPFFGSNKRVSNILKAITLWRMLQSSNVIERYLLKVEASTTIKGGHFIGKKRYEEILQGYTAVIGISKATAVEMGGAWPSKMIYFDPGVSLDEEDMETIRSIKERVKEKEAYAVFGGRPTAEKGVAEALVSFKIISKHLPKLKLIITGRIEPKTLLYINRACKKLDIEDKVVITGFVPREKRFEIVAKARLMLYPSHVDAFPYAVLESLHLGTPVVAYKIPALEIYYGKSPGVELVEEGDIEALTVKAIDVLEKGVETVEPPKIKSWKEIMNEEIEMIRKIALK